MSAAFRSYLASQIPGWLLAVPIAWMLYRWAVLPGWLAIALCAAWVVKDLLLFPIMHRFYRSEPAAKRLVGRKGTAVTALDPEGLVRVHGVLWQARAGEPVSEGASVRVLGIQGLILLVDTDAGTRP